MRLYMFIIEKDHLWLIKLKSEDRIDARSPHRRVEIYLSRLWQMSV